MESGLLESHHSSEGRKATEPWPTLCSMATQHGGGELQA